MILAPTRKFGLGLGLAGLMEWYLVVPARQAACMPVPVEKGKINPNKRQKEAHDLDTSQNRPFCFLFIS